MSNNTKKEIKIKNLYKWWRNPIKYWKDRKKINVMNILANHWWKNSGEEEQSSLLEKLDEAYLRGREDVLEEIIFGSTKKN